MPSQPGVNAYAVAVGTAPGSFQAPEHFDVRIPNSLDVHYPIGTVWINTNGNSVYVLTSLTSSNGATTANWTNMGSAAGSLNTLTGDAGGAISPSSNNITVAGTANQITTTGAGSTITWSLASALVAPGSITSTTTMTAGTGLTVTTGDATVTAGNVIINGAAKQLRVHGGAATDFIGQATLALGTVDVLNTNIAATDRVIVTRSSKNGSTAYGEFIVTITPATKFNITACKPADTTTETGDTSIVDYFIVRQV